MNFVNLSGNAHFLDHGRFLSTTLLSQSQYNGLQLTTDEVLASFVNHCVIIIH